MHCQWRSPNKQWWNTSSWIQLRLTIVTLFWWVLAPIITEIVNCSLQCGSFSQSHKDDKCWASTYDVWSCNHDQIYLYVKLNLCLKDCQKKKCWSTYKLHTKQKFNEPCSQHTEKHMELRKPCLRSKVIPLRIWRIRRLLFLFYSICNLLLILLIRKYFSACCIHITVFVELCWNGLYLMSTNGNNG